MLFFWVGMVSDPSGQNHGRFVSAFIVDDRVGLKKTGNIVGLVLRLRIWVYMVDFEVNHSQILNSIVGNQTMCLNGLVSIYFIW